MMSNKLPALNVHIAVKKKKEVGPSQKMQLQTYMRWNLDSSEAHYGSFPKVLLVKDSIIKFCEIVLFKE